MLSRRSFSLSILSLLSLVGTTAAAPFCRKKKESVTLYYVSANETFDYPISITRSLAHANFMRDSYNSYDVSVKLRVYTVEVPIRGQLVNENC